MSAATGAAKAPIKTPSKNTSTKSAPANGTPAKNAKSCHQA